MSEKEIFLSPTSINNMLIALIIFICATITLGGCTFYLYQNRIKTIQINSERQKENEQIEIRINEKQQQFANLKNMVQEQQNLIKSLNETENEMREGAKQRAQEYYDSQVAALNKQYKEEQQNWESKLEVRKQIALDEVRREEQKLAELEAKQTAYLEAQQRQEEMDKNRDYYRLVIDQVDLDDIDLLRDLQKRFSRKDSIDKLIWENYYKPAYDILISHVLPESNKICGIYKITDLTTGQAYIGQSVDIKERFRQHIKSALAYGTATNKLYQTMKKSGLYNFTFEVLEKVSREKLNQREVYWIDFYKTKEYGMNGTRGGS